MSPAFKRTRGKHTMDIASCIAHMGRSIGQIGSKHGYGKGIFMDMADTRQGTTIGEAFSIPGFVK